MKLYKFFAAGGISVFQKTAWPMPVNGAPGAWLPGVEGPLKLCVNGYHACRAEWTALWAAEVLAEVEIGGEMIEEEEKLCGRGPARILRVVTGWTAPVMIGWAVDCAEHVLPVYERSHPDDARVRRCIEVTRRFLRGEATREELDNARVAAEEAWAIARASAWFGWDTARAAAKAACATWAAGDAADAWAAAGAAVFARDATGASELDWQSARLLELAGETIAE